jgi:hypothetical protein
MGLIVAGFWLLTILIEGRFRKPHLFHAFVLFFILWNVVSYLWTVDVDRTVQRIITYGQIFILMLIVWEEYRKPADVIYGLQAYVLGSFVCIGSSISNYLSGTVAGAVFCHRGECSRSIHPVIVGYTSRMAFIPCRKSTKESHS